MEKRFIDFNLKRIFISFVLCSFLFFLFFVPSPSIAYADDSDGTVPTNVIDDLRRDTSFNVSDYPVNNSDYSLKVISVAESATSAIGVDGYHDFYIYVYQPCYAKNFRATHLSYSVRNSTSSPLVVVLGSLTYVNSSGTLFKYRCSDVQSSFAQSGYYFEINSIFRRYDSSIDSQPTAINNSISEVSYNVSKQWYIARNGNTVTYKCFDIETITVTDKFVGYVRYDAGYLDYTLACDSHFVAFNTDKRMDKLMEAQVFYKSVDVVRMIDMFGDDYNYSNPTEHNVTLNSDSGDVTYSGGGLFGHTYSWQRIQKVEDLIGEGVHPWQTLLHEGTYTTSQIQGEAREQLENMTWVLRFAETPYSYYGGSLVAPTTWSSCNVFDVTILRLKFETDGKTYNLGVIDNMQSGGSDPINEETVLPSDVEIESKILNFFSSDRVRSFFQSIGKFFLILMAVLAFILLIFGIIKLVQKSVEYKANKSIIKNSKTSKKGSSKSVKKK